jgi:hypothetical protein
MLRRVLRRIDLPAARTSRLALACGHILAQPQLRQLHGEPCGAYAYCPACACEWRALCTAAGKPDLDHDLGLDPRW